MKKCFKCNITKPLDDFYKHPAMSDNRLGKCKTCAKVDVKKNYTEKAEQYREYDKTRQRKSIKRIYNHRYNQIRARVDGFATRHYKVQGTEMLSREEFSRWCEANQDTFDYLYKMWESYDFNKKFAPSIDRINNEIGYVPDNMQWLSFSENSKKGDK